jgi:tubulin---tyrosine ligase
MTNKGAEILLFDTKLQLENFFKSRVIEQNRRDNGKDANDDQIDIDVDDLRIDLREWVIQRYIHRPLALSCYNSRKFHLRVYIVAVGNLSVYVYEDILALFSMKPYTNVPFIDHNKIDMNEHITNTCVQLDCYSNHNIDGNNNNNNTMNLKTKHDIENECVKQFWQLNLGKFRT